MPRISDLRCPGCGAGLPVVEGAAVATCTYCGNEVMVRHTQHAMPASRVMPPGGVVQSTPGTRVSPLIIIVPILLVFAGIAGTIYYVVHKVTTTANEIVHNTTSGMKTNTGARDTSGSATPPEMRVRVRWVAYAQKAIARVNADDIDDLIGLAYFSQEDNDTYVIAVDGSTREQLWKAGPYGNNTVAAATNTKFAVMGEKLVVTDYRAMVRVITLATGKEERATSLTDRAEWICPHPTDTGQAWIEVADRNHVALTVATATVKPQNKRPAHCLEWHERIDCDELGAVECVPERRAGKFRAPKGTSIDMAMRDGNHLIGAGYKQPGTNYSLLVAFEADGRRVKWQRRVVDTDDAANITGKPEFLDMAAGRVFVYYEIGRDGHHMIAIDATTGETVWDIELPGKGGSDPDPEAIVASATRVFVMSGEVVYVFDPADGTLLGQVGERW